MKSFVYVLALIASASAFISGDPATGGGGGPHEPPCKVEKCGNGPNCGACNSAVQSLTGSSAAAGQLDDAAKSFLEGTCEGEEKPVEPRHLATEATAVPFGSVGEGCHQHCCWSAPYCVYHWRRGWVNVVQTPKFKQLIRYCWCGSYGGTCHGFLMFYFYWEATCEKLYAYRLLYVWVKTTTYVPTSFAYVTSYKIKLIWFRFPSACACGHPTSLSCKFHHG